MKGAEIKKVGPHYWFLDTHFAVSFRVKIDDVVTAVVVAAVHQHGVQDVVGRVLGVRLLEELVQRQLVGKLEPGEEREERRRGEDGNERE